MASRELLVRITGDSRSLDRALKQSTATTKRFEDQTTTTLGRVDKSFTRLQRVAAGGFLGGIAIAQGKAMVDVASNLEEQLSRTNVVFGTSADAVEAWSKTTASSIGIAQDEALAAAGTFGAMFLQAGQVPAEAARLSESMVTLASDLASFNNASIEDTLTAIRSGLSGEIEPLRRFQVFLTEAAVSQRAMADTGKTNVAQLTQGEKILARYALILEQTGKQQGDYARTSESLANQQRRLSAEFRDLQAKAGAGLLPIMTKLTNFAGDATVAIQGLGGALEQLGQVKITPLQIPLNFTIVSDRGGGDVKVGDLFKANIVEIGKLGLDAFRGTGPFGKGEHKVKPAELTAGAKAFDEAFTPFTDSFIEGGKKAAAKSRDKISKAFGSDDFKPVPNDLGERLQKQFDESLAALDLSFDIAATTPGTADELAVLKKTEDRIKARIASEGRTTELGRKLFEVQQRRRQIFDELADDARRAREKAKQDAEDRRKAAADAAREAREAAHDARLAQQFRAIGLSAEGGDIIPGLPNLRRQFASLSQRMIGEDVPRKLGDRMKLVGKFLSSGIKKIEPEVATAINDLFRTIRGEFDDESKKGPLTKTSGLNTRKLLEGLGLGPEAEKELRARLSGFNTAGVSLAGRQRPTGQFRGGPVVIENHTTVSLDGEVVGRNVTRNQQKNRRRNPTQKRGPNSGV